MKNLMKLAPLVLVVLAMSACGGGGGTADPKDIGEAALKKITSMDFDSLDSLMDHDVDLDAVKEIRDWQIKEGYERWKDYKKGLEGDAGSDPKSKSGIDGEEKWKEMSYGKKLALDWGLYRLYANDDAEKRLKEMTWARAQVKQELEVEGQGRAVITSMNGYSETITVTCQRKNGLWYLTSVKVSMDKELPKKPKDD